MKSKKRSDDDIGALIRLLTYAMLEARRLGLERIASEIAASLDKIPNFDAALRAHERG